MRKFSHVFCFQVMLGVALSLTAQAQTSNPTAPELKAGQEYKFVSTTKTSTFEKELQAVAAEGYRFIRLSKAFNDLGVSGLLAREPLASGEAAKPRYEYKVLATNRLSTMKKELEESSAQGYEFRGITTQAKWAPFTYPETLIVMERPAGTAKKRFAYRFISAQKESSVQKELDTAVSEGFEPVEMIFGEDVNKFSVLFGSGFNYHTTIVLVRNADAPAAEMGKREYRYLSTTKVGTMEKEMNQSAKEGFEFHLASIGSIALMMRPRGEKTPRYTYTLLATRRTGTMQKELAETGKQGLLFLGTSSGAGGLVSIMEKNLKLEGSPQYDYKFLGTTLESTTQKEINESLNDGYRFIEISSFNERVIVLGKLQGAK